MPRAGWLAGPRQPDEDPRGQPPGRGAQLTVGGAGQVGQQGHGGVRVGGQQPGERLLVEPPQLGRDLRERGVPGGQLGPADAPPGGAPAPVAAGRGRRGAGGRGWSWPGPSRLVPAAGGGRRSAFPWPSRDPAPGHRELQSELRQGAADPARRPARARPAARRARTPGSARSRRRSGSARTARRARRPGRSPASSAARRAAGPGRSSSRTRSIAPRTEEPIRTSGAPGWPG